MAANTNNPNNDIINDLPRPLAESTVAPGHAAARSVECNIQALLGCVQQLKAGQTHQTDLIQKLQKTVLTSRSMINELVVANNELKEELDEIKRTLQCDGFQRKEVAATVSQAMMSHPPTPATAGDVMYDRSGAGNVKKLVMRLYRRSFSSYLSTFHRRVFLRRTFTAQDKPPTTKSPTLLKKGGGKGLGP
mmetsp:Transcript_19955/g.42816  ORF Transcript_19955/g.42816 Transcript_19955/m.42816 type:complete len:191 (+) Transcript_19955:90-662(+)